MNSSRRSQEKNYRSMRSVATIICFGVILHCESQCFEKNTIRLSAREHLDVLYLGSSLSVKDNCFATQERLIFSIGQRSHRRKSGLILKMFEMYIFHIIKINTGKLNRKCC